jgi:hypothetical protein
MSDLRENLAIEAAAVLAWLDGHDGHGGVRYDRATRQITCKGCQTPLYEYGEVA